MVSVDLIYTNDSLALRVVDNGPGLDPSTIEEDGAHWGITTMRERVAQVEGEFQLRSAPGQGTAIEVRVPLRVRQRGEASAPGHRSPG
jgi:signal transduction histidine kinase